MKKILLIGLLIAVFLLSACVKETGKFEEESGPEIISKAVEEDPPIVLDTTRTGIIGSDEIWSGTIHVTGDIDVREGATLTILPGTIIKIAAFSDDQHKGKDKPHDPPFPKDPDRLETQSTQIRIDGILNAIGTPENMIVFTSDSDNPTTYDWDGLIINHGKLEYAIVEYSRYNGIQGSSDVVIANSIFRNMLECCICIGHSAPISPQILNNDIYNCGHEGIDYAGGSALIKGNYFHQENREIQPDPPRGGLGIVVYKNAYPIIEDNTFEKNSIGILFSNNSLNEEEEGKKVILRNNTMEKNNENIAIDPGYPAEAIVTETADLVARVGGENGTHSSIQKAIDAVSDAGTVQVSQGTYLENITITSPKTFTLQGGWNQEFTSRSEDSSLTVIDGGGNDSVVDIGAGHGVEIALTIEGFTIQNGNANDGGGISIASGSSLDLTLINNNISGNTADMGGGVYIVSVGGFINATLINNNISENTVTEAGGGIYVNSTSAGSAEVTLTGNVITGNTVTNPFEEPPSDGGAIAAYASDSDATTKLQLTNNLITENEAGAGGGIWDYAWGPNAMFTMVLTNNIIAGNKAVYGAGIFSASGKSCPITKPEGSVILTLTNNTITGNIASIGHSGILLYSGSTYGDGGTINLSMQNDILWGNTDPHEGAQLSAIVEKEMSGIATADVSYSNIGSLDNLNDGGNYTLENVIDKDPLFIDSGNQVFLLQDDSPCIDAGNPNSAYNDIWYPPSKGTERNDMGAYGGPAGALE